MIRPNRPCMARQGILADFKQRDSPKISAEMRFLFIFTTILTYLTLPRPSKLVYFLLCLPILRGRHFEIMDLPFCKSLEKRNDHGCIHSPVMERQVLNRKCGEKTILILSTIFFFIAGHSFASTLRLCICKDFTCFILSRDFIATLSRLRPSSWQPKWKNSLESWNTLSKSLTCACIAASPNSTFAQRLTKNKRRN